MYIHSVKLYNYKSLGDKLNEIIIEPNITAIIGKNESGKSNVLEGLSQINFVGSMQQAFSVENANRNNGREGIIEYEVVLRPNNEKELHGLKDETRITMGQHKYSATGSILQYYSDNLKDVADSFIVQMEGNPFQLRDVDLRNFQAYVKALQPEEILNIRRIHAGLKFFENQISKLSTEKRQVFTEVLQPLKEKWTTLVQVLPVVFYRNSNKVLKSSYKFEDVKKELSTPNSVSNSLLYDLVKLIDISVEDFLNAVQAGSSGSKISIRDKIRRAINTTINKRFENFYHAEKVNLDVQFDSNIVTFSVRTDEGEMLSLGERSNGLRWYLNMYIDAMANGVAQSNVVYLFDEPGVSLHVKAQEELLKLFDHLASKGNQIIYSTHSPYMLNMDNNGIHRIRSVVKDTDGFTYIYRNAYDGKISRNVQKDTLTPIIEAIGMDLRHTFGPAFGKKNIVCEGASDYIYFFTIAKRLGIDLNQVNFIPSLGVTNAVNICNILNGWGCEFAAVFDYDKEGVEKGGNKMKNTLLYQMEEHFLYLKKTEESAIASKEYVKNSVMIEDLIGRDGLKEFIKIKGLPKDADKKNKVLLAKMYCDSVENGEITFSTECYANFKHLFGRLSLLSMED